MENNTDNLCDSEESEFYAEEEYDIESDVDSVMRGEEIKIMQQCNFKILEYSELNSEMNQMATELSAVILYPVFVCRTLLHFFKWNKEELLDKFYESTSLEAYGISSKQLTDSNALIVKTSVKNELCAICDELKENLCGLHCEHLFCEECWREYLSSMIISQGQSKIDCPAYKCSLVVSDEVVLRIIGNNSSMTAKFLRIVANRFVNSNRLMKFCPAENCSLTVKVLVGGCQPVECKCGHSYCFECVLPWHDPASCELMSAWYKRCSDDSETFNWINTFTKDCPKCHATIEKNGGCNHMICRSASCKHEFCWMCMKSWNIHNGSYLCNRYDDASTDDEPVKKKASRVALGRYLHYYNRFRNHENSLKLEDRICGPINNKINLMQNNNFSFVETQFLWDALGVLRTCRRTLMHTYAFAFYLSSNNMTDLFESNQQDLELATEALSEILENDVEKQDFIKLKIMVQDKARYVEQRRLILIRHCIEGTERNEWSFNDPDIRIGTISL